MTKVIIKGKFNTVWGLTLAVSLDPGSVIKVDDRIAGDDGNNYIVKGINPPTRPGNMIYGLIVEGL